MFHSIRKGLRFAGAAVVILLAGAAGVAIGGGGATGTGYTAFGAISDFGSIFVNGIEFFTEKASITIDGSPNRSESDLEIGMVLTVNGTVDGSGTKGDAATVVYQSDALGRIDRAPAGGEFGVLGQSITTNARTVFAGFISLEELEVGDFVEVSGFRSEAGVLASRVERKSSVPRAQVKGTIASVTSTTFTLGSLTVDYSMASRKNFPSGGLANGLNVVANGPVPVDGRLVATSVEVLNQGVGGNSNGSVSGVVAAVDSSSLSVNGQAISITSSTQYVNGKATDLAPGKLVKVDFSVYGSIAVATKIEFTALKAATHLEADVTAKYANGFEVLGPGGAIVSFTSATEWRDQSDARLPSFGLANIAVGDHVDIRGNEIDDGSLRAERIVRQRPSPVILISGRAMSIAAPKFTVVDIDIATDAGTDFRDGSGAPISAAAFFTRAAGHRVDVSAARRADGSLVATLVRMD